jgi:hypothetical protein
MSMSQSRTSQNLVSRHDASSIPTLQGATSNLKSHHDTNDANSNECDFLGDQQEAETYKTGHQGEQKDNDPLYLDGLSIFVGEGFSDVLVARLRKIVREGGGNLMTRVSFWVSADSISRVISTIHSSFLYPFLLLVLGYRYSFSCIGPICHGKGCSKANRRHARCFLQVAL